MLKTRTFPTTVDMNYSIDFTINDIEETRGDFNDFVQIDQKGNFYDNHYQRIPDPGLFESSSLMHHLPDPSDYIKEETYKNAVDLWYKKFREFLKKVVFPVPMGSFFSFPSMPHVPSTQEKVPGSLQNRMAAKAFSVRMTPLYPSNFLEMITSILNGEFVVDSYFHCPGPRGQTILRSNHMSEVTPWHGQFVPLKPRPKIFKDYNDFNLAFMRWYQLIVQNNTIPLHPRDFKDILHVEYQHFRDSKRRNLSLEASDYFLNSNSVFSLDDSNPPSILSFTQIPEIKDFQEPFLLQIKLKGQAPKSERFLQKAVVGFESIYKETFLIDSKSMKPKTIAFVSLPPCSMIYNEWSNYGVSYPNVYKGIPLGISLVSTSSNTHFLPISSFKELFYYLDLPFHPVIRFHIYNCIYEAFRVKQSRFREVLVSDLTTLYEIHKVFSEYSSNFKETPPMFSFPISDSILNTMQSIFLSYSLMQDFFMFFQELNNGMPETIDYFRNRIALIRESIIAFIREKREIIGDVLSSYLKENPYAVSVIMYLVLECDIPEVTTFLYDLDPPPILILSRISRIDTKGFDFIKRRVLFSIRASISVILQLSNVNYDPSSILRKSTHSFVDFLSNIMVVRFPKGSLTNDINWGLLFVTTIVSSHSFPDQIYYDYVYSISVYIQNRMAADRTNPTWKDFIPQFESILLAAVSAMSNDASKLILLKAFRRLLWHPSSTQFLQHLQAVLPLIIDIISSENKELSISGIKTLRIIVINHQHFLQSLRSNHAIFVRLTTQICTIDPEKILEIIKMVNILLLMPWINKEMIHFKSFLEEIRFRLPVALLTARRANIPKKKFYTQKLVQLLEEKPSYAQILHEVDSAVASKTY